MILFTIARPEMQGDFALTQTGSKEEQNVLIFKNPESTQARAFKLSQRVVPLEGGNVLLRLRQAAVVEIDLARRCYRIPNWGLEIPVGEFGEIPRLLARKFLELFSHAQFNRLSDSEKANWANILNEVDYAAFSNDRSAPRYVEGRIIGRKPEVTVEWHDGERQIIPSRTAGALDLIKEGEDFGAFVKWGRGNRVQNVERVTLLSPDLRTDDDWLDELKPH